MEPMLSKTIVPRTTSPTSPTIGVPSLARRNAARAALVAASTTLEYALMLVAMTYQAELLLAVVLGLALGPLLPSACFDLVSRSGAKSLAQSST